jgi:hypothetical protein
MEEPEAKAALAVNKNSEAADARAAERRRMGCIMVLLEK